MSTLIEKLERERKTHHDLMLQSPTLQDSAYYNGVTVGFMGAIGVVKQHSDWISVDERLPSEYEVVLAIGYGEVKLAQYSDGVWQGVGYGQFMDFMNVKFWQPLPQPPSEVKP